jgi:hypothetical protein
MSEHEKFVPKRYDVLGANLPPGIDNLGELDNALSDLTNDMHLDTVHRRATTARLAGLGWRATPHLAEHLAWLLEHETDELSACNLYYAILATHPQAWLLREWQLDLLNKSQLVMLRTVIITGFLSSGEIDIDDAQGKQLLKHIDHTNPEQRAELAKHLWLIDHKKKPSVAAVIEMLQPNAHMLEKTAALTVVKYTSDTRLKKSAQAPIRELFRSERQPRLSQIIGDHLVRLSTHAIDLELAVFFIQTWHRDEITAAKDALQRVFYSVESFLMDSFALGEERSSELTNALLAKFSASSLPNTPQALVQALTELSTDAQHSVAALAATAALQAAHSDNALGVQFALSIIQSNAEPKIRALAIRALGTKPFALTPIAEQLKTYAGARDTHPRIRRAAFDVLINTHQSGLRIKLENVIDLYFQYLTGAPFDHFADAMYTYVVAKNAHYFLSCLDQHLDKISSQSARIAAFNLINNSFGFGIDEAFTPHWLSVVRLMLRALDKPRHGDLHHQIFWNALHEVPMPIAAANEFSAGLKNRLKRIKYTKRTASMMEDWLVGNNKLKLG